MFFANFIFFLNWSVVLDIKDFLEAGERMLNIFTALPWMSPFNMLDTKAERERVANLFTEEKHKKIKTNKNT